MVVGASGQLGAELSRELAGDGAAQVLRSGRTAEPGQLVIDLARLRTAEDATAALQGSKPDLVLCVGAMTFVDGCEDDPQRAFLVNAHGPAALASYARGREVPFVYVSSDYVFDGSDEHPGPYTESSVTRPLNVYGQSKLQGEQDVLRAYPEALVVRTSWVYGPDAAGKNFVSSLLRQLRSGQRVRVPSDQISTPTFNRDLAGIMLALVAAHASGVVHVAGPQMFSRLQLAQEIAQFFRLDETLIEGLETRNLGQRALRPLRSGLQSETLQCFVPEARLRSLQDCLELTASLLV